MEKWEREPLTDEEGTAIFEKCTTPEESLIVAFLADTGCRVNELLRYKRDWDDRDGGKYGTLNVPVMATSGKRPKTKKPKSIPVTRRLRECMDAIPTTMMEVVVARTPQHIYNVVNRLGEAAGLYTIKKEKGKKTVYSTCCGVEHSKGWHVTPHIFRHTMACRLYYNVGDDPEDKMTMEEIGHFLGHANGDMVKNVYLHIDDKKIKSKIESGGFLE